jgi:multiple antibiotic resistance protein
LELLQEIIGKFVILWAVIDPIGTLPVFISATEGRTAKEKRHIAWVASVAAATILLFFIIAGEPMLLAMGVPLTAFQIAGGIVLFLFALTMIFGESKPDSETEMLRSVHETAVFPLATPSIASPGAMMAVVLLTENQTHTISDQVLTASVMLAVVASAFLIMLAAGFISHWIGRGGASVVSRVMGMIIASIAATHILEGAKAYFQS